MGIQLAGLGGQIEKGQSEANHVNPQAVTVVSSPLLGSHSVGPMLPLECLRRASRARLLLPRRLTESRDPETDKSTWCDQTQEDAKASPGDRERESCPSPHGIQTHRFRPS